MGGWETCDECSWTPGPGGSCPWWVSQVRGVLRCALSGGGGVGVRGEIGDGGEFKSQCLVEGWGRARTGGEHDHLD